MSYIVYVLRSKKDLHYYIGQTKSLEKRLAWHGLGLVRSTSNRRPLELMFSEEYPTRGEAMKRERYLKRLKSGNEFKRIISDKKN